MMMTSKRLTGLAMFLATVCGFLLGLASIQTARATTTYNFQIMGGANSYMNCGWHTVCQSPNYGSALAMDWTPISNHWFYFRMFGFQSAGSPGVVGRGFVQSVNDLEHCKAVYINIGSPAGGTYRGSEEYLHVTTSAGGATIDLSASTSGYWVHSGVGQTVTSENWNCPWTGEHLHQFAYWENVFSSARNTAVYPNAVNAGPYYIDVQGYHQDAANWSY